jgi:CheY-like chemotaxis protein
MRGDSILLSLNRGPMWAEGDSYEGEIESRRTAKDFTEPSRSRSKVLVVDDQKLIADTLVEILENAGFDAIAAYGGWDALDVASRFHPDWLLSDVVMPRMNGVELAIAIRTSYPKTTILLFSGQAGITEIVEEGQRKGYEFELIAKPIHPLKLIERLKEGEKMVHIQGRSFAAFESLPYSTCDISRRRFL